jgi:adenine-specific DNA-methyltransferase
MFERLLEKLKELFQLNQPELDFGIYRIMHAKSSEITQFLEHDLLSQVKNALSAYQSVDRDRIEQELADAVAQAEGLGVDPETSKKVQDLRSLLSESPDGAAVEAEVYEALYRFFRRYYTQGDFLSRRVYKKDVYAIPYEGEEVALHWANKDQYYIKSSETLRDYAFRLRPDDTTNPMRVHFRVVGADEEEHNTVKAAEGKQRVFLLAENRPPEEIDGDLHVYFRYEQLDKKQSDLNAKAIDWFKTSAPKALAEWKSELLRAAPTKSDEARTVLEKHLEQYTARNTFDYFIHKDLGGFLRRELDFFIKNEVMQLDDIEDATAQRADQYLAKIKAIRVVAGKIITFLAELEDFQKKLWLKKKFVHETQYLIAAHLLPAVLLQEAVENREQVAEWSRLAGIRDNTVSLFDGEDSQWNGRYVNTAYFDSVFVGRALQGLHDLDSMTDGVLVHSDNFQGLNLIERRFREEVDLIYIDPPYNTDASEILYKNDYRHSSWLALMADRLEIARHLMSDEAIMQVAIDDAEFSNLELLLKQQFGRSNYISTVVVVHNPKGRDQGFFATSHEYTLVVGKNKANSTTYRLPLGKAELETKYKGEGDDGRFRELPLKRTGSESARSDRPSMFFPFVVDLSTGTLDVVSDEEYEKIQATPVDDGSYVDELRSAYKKKGKGLIVPLKDDGRFGRWRWGFPQSRSGVESGVLFAKKLRTGDFAVYQRDEADETFLPKTFWVGERYDASSKGTNVLKDILGPNDFDYPKSIFAVEDFVRVGSSDDDVVLDFFGGSGTTAHAIMNLNRLSGTRRKFILLEGGAHFKNVLLERVLRILYSSEWKNGASVRTLSAAEVASSPRVVKVVKIEQYEDTLNNLDIKRPEGMDDLFSGGEPALREEYVLRYMLDVETRGSASLLNAAAFVDPRKYTLRVKAPGTDETVETAVDLIETFNWLLGLRVRHIAASESFEASFTEKGKRLVAELATANGGPFWFRQVSGTLPDGREALVVWRVLTGDVANDEAALLAWFEARGHLNSETLDVVYVNGDCNLAAAKPASSKWTLESLDARFHELMFEGVAD